MLKPKPVAERDYTISAFKYSLRLVNFSDNKFNTELNPHQRKKKVRGNMGKFALAVKYSVSATISRLFGRESSDPVLLIDEGIRIDKFADGCNNR